MDRKMVGLIAMGSRHNRPLWQDMISLFEPEIRVEMRGVLDGISKEEIEEQFSFEKGENYIVTEMYWGGTVHISEAKARTKVAQIADELFAEDAAAVLVLCTGDFFRPGSEEWKAAVAEGKCAAERKKPEEAAAEGTETGERAGEGKKSGYSGLFLLPEDLIYGVLSGLHQERIGFIVPEEDQIRESEEHYAALHPLVRAASPYGSMDKLAAVAESFRGEDVQVIVTDCMGFQASMGRMVAEKSGKQVIVPRLLLPKIIRAMVTVS